MPGVRDLEVRHLVALRAVAEEGSFGRAATRLGFSQAAISQQIAGLERTIGQPVFDRPGGPRAVEITPAGELLLRHAERILEQFADAERELAELRAGTHGRLVVGTFQSVSVKLLPAIVARLRRETPELDITLFERDLNEDLVDALLEGQLDLTFLASPVDDDRVTTVELCVDPFVVVLPPGTDDPDADYPTAQLCGRSMVGQMPSSCQDLVDGGLQAVGVTPRYVFRSNDNAAVQAMVRAGMGPAVLPLLAVDADDPGVTVRALDPPIPPRSIVVATRRGRTRSPAADRFVEIARETAVAL